VVWILSFVFLLTLSVVVQHEHIPSPSPTPTPAADKLYPIPANVTTPCVDYNPVAHYEGEPDADADMRNVMVPIPMEDRVGNGTGIQCVWSSIETLARYARFERLYNMTDLPECKSYSGPSSAGRWLKSKNVRFEQTIGGDRSLILKGVVKEGRGVLFSVPGHAMVLVHYDEEKGEVKYINNSDKSLKIRTWSMKEFNRRFDGWVMIVYADNDLFKRGEARTLPVFDKNNPQGKYPDDYIPLPLEGRGKR
jgi:hypothetical protein